MFISFTKKLFYYVFVIIYDIFFLPQTMEFSFIKRFFKAKSKLLYEIFRYNRRNPSMYGLYDILTDLVPAGTIINTRS